MRVLPGPCYILSDAHLGVAPADRERALRVFLSKLTGNAGSVVVNGDLFDFWFEWRTVMPRTGYRVIAALADLVDAGTQVIWIAGNHDCWGGELLQREAGVEFLLNGWRGSVAGWQTQIDHGDGLRDQEDRRYRQLRRVLRNGLAIRAFRALHPDLASRVALRSSQASRDHQPAGDGEGLRRVAMRDLEADRDIELRVLGHSHIAALERAPGGGVYANSGNWLTDTTYLRVDTDAVSLLRWRDGAAEELATIPKTRTGSA